MNLDGLTSLTDKAAESIAIHDLDGELSLCGLTFLSNEAFNTLAGLKRRLILRCNFTKELTNLSAKAAIILANHKGDLNLSGLTSLSDKTAKALANHEGTLELSGLTSLSDKAAEALANHKGDLYLGGLTSLSDKSAEALAKHKSVLHLPSLTSYKQQGRRGTDQAKKCFVGRI